MNDPSSDISHRTISAALWGTFGSVGRVVLQISVQIVLARILGPDQYGVFAICALTVGISAYLADIGLAYGLVQRKQIDEFDIRFVWTCQLILGLASTIFVLLVAPLIGQITEEPRVVEPLRVLSAVVLMLALSATSTNLLKRSLNFRMIQISQILGYFLGYALCGVTLAIAGLGVWALIWAWIVQVFTSSILMFRAARHPIHPTLKHHNKQNMLQFSAIVFTTNVVNWIVNNIDKVVVARYFSTYQIGLYSTAFNLVNTPVTAVYGAIQSVAFSASARINDQHEKIRSAYLATTGLTLLVSLPLFGGIALAAKEIIVAFYGYQWIEAVPLFAVFSLGMPLMLLWGISTPILWNTNQATQEIRIQIPFAIITLLVSLTAAQISIFILAIAVLMVSISKILYLLSAVVRTLEISIHDLWLISRGPIIYALLCAASIIGSTELIKLMNTHAVVTLLIQITSGAFGFVVSLLLFRSLLDSRVRELLIQISAKTPHRINSTFQWLISGRVR